MRKLLTLILTMIGIAGCGTTGGQSIPTTIPTQPVNAGAPIAAPPEATAPTPTTAPETGQPATPYPAPETGQPATPYPAPGGQGSIDAPAELVRAAQERLAQLLQKPAAQLLVQQAERKQWPDTSLGCPEPGKVYDQVTVPGFLVTLSDGTRSYAVHTSLSAMPGEDMLLCDNQKPTDLSALAAPTPPPSADVQRMADLARQDLATKLGIDPSAVTVVSTAAVEWNDSSLGCPKPDTNYLQVITSGYLIRLEAQGQGYEYHTDTRMTVVQCIP